MGTMQTWIYRYLMYTIDKPCLHFETFQCDNNPGLYAIDFKIFSEKKLQNVMLDDPVTS